MVKLREGDQARVSSAKAEALRLTLSIPLTAKEKASILPGPLDWGALHGDIVYLQRATIGEGTLYKNIKPRTTDIVGLAEKIASRINEFIDGYLERNTYRIAVLGFKYHWTILRNWVPLQLRLCVEQVLWTRGRPWRDLVTGFGAIEEGR